MGDGAQGDLIAEELLLLGSALIEAQKVEFAFGGIIAHMTHFKGLKEKDRRLKDIDPEVFLRGDPKKMKITLGQMANLAGEEFSLDIEKLSEFCDRRNTVMHNYYRLAKAELRDDPFAINDGRVFLQQFIHDAEYWLKIFQGIVALLKKGAAIKQGVEIELTASELNAIGLYREQVEQSVYKQLLIRKPLI